MAPKQGLKKWYKHGGHKGTSTVWLSRSARNPEKHQETKQQTKTETNNQKTTHTKSGDVTSTSLWVKRSEKAGGDNLVSSRNMHEDILCAI